MSREDDLKYVKEMEFRGVPIKVFPAGYPFTYSPMAERRHVVIQKRGEYFIDVIMFSFMPYTGGYKVLANIVIEDKLEIKRDRELEPLSLEGILSRGMVKITEDEYHALLEGVTPYVQTHETER